MLFAEAERRFRTGDVEDDQVVDGFGLANAAMSAAIRSTAWRTVRAGRTRTSRRASTRRG